MLDLVARKSSTGEVYLNIARAYLRKHEWGMARMAIEDALSKGHLRDPAKAHRLSREISRRLSTRPELLDGPTRSQHSRNPTGGSTV